GESNANQSDLTPAQGAWINVVIFLPIGIFLTYKVNNDSVIFNKEGLIIRLKEIFSFKYLKRSN
ncbi:MAG: permease, partial [Bacteroidetes bacterium]|nr:permease [Bacteroidota bacterium]